MIETSGILLSPIFSKIHESNETVIYDTNNDANISGQELYKKVLSIRLYLQYEGFSHGDKVIIYIRNQIDFIAILMAVLSLGGVVVVLEPGMGRKVLQEKIKTINPEYIFLEGIIYDISFLDFLGIFGKYLLRNIPKELYQSSAKYIYGGKAYFGTLHKRLNNIYKQKSNISPSKVNIFLDDEALIVFTGGTTSNPKGVIHTHSSLYETIQEVQKIVGKYEVFYADLFHFVLLGIASGSTVILGDENYSPKKVQNIFQKHNVACSFIAPYKIQQFLDADIDVSQNLDCLITGSAPVYTSFLERLDTSFKSDIQVLCLYGMTEMLPISYTTLSQKLSYTGKSGDYLGKVLEGVQYKITEDSELLISGKHASKSYLGGDRCDYISSGDIVEEYEGNLILKGRKKDMILRGNYNIYPSLYEGIISSIPGIKECSMFGIHENDVNEYIVLLIDSEKKYSPEDILDFLKKGKYSVDNFALPQYIFFGKIPKYGRQKKVQKHRLAQLYSEKVVGK